MDDMRAAVVGFIVLVGVLLFVGSRMKPAQSTVAPAAPRATGYHGLPDPYVDAEATEAEIKKLALRTHGDFSKLSQDEQTWFNGMTANHGEETLINMAKRYHALPGIHATKQRK